MLDTNYLTLLPQDIDPKVIGPVLCAGVTAYKAVKNANLKPGEWLCVIGAGGGLGHLAVQFGLAVGAKVLGIDAGESKKSFIESLGAQFLDFTKSSNLVEDVKGITSGGSHAAVVTSGHPVSNLQFIVSGHANNFDPWRPPRHLIIQLECTYARPFGLTESRWHSNTPRTYCALVEL